MVKATVEHAPLPSKVALVIAFVGQNVSPLRVWAFVVIGAIATKNCAEMPKNASRSCAVKAWFHPPVKMYRMGHPTSESFA